MKTDTSGDTIKTITTHYIDETFVESHGCEVTSCGQTGVRDI